MTYSFGELDEVALPYATTIHKSQGSEYPAVVIPVTTQPYPMLQRDLLYTAVTRGKRLVVIVGQKKAMAIAVKGKQTGRRWSKLREWLASTVDGVEGNSPTCPTTPMPGIFVLFDGLGLVDKRLDCVANSDRPTVRIISDNPICAPCKRSAGRIRWFAREI